MKTLVLAGLFLVLGVSLPATIHLRTLAQVGQGLRIPPEVLRARFTKQHPFRLKVHGPNPVFSQGGYPFKVNTDGFELSDDYYYNVPVFIDVDLYYGTPGYRLYR